MSQVPSLLDLCIYNALGTDFLAQSLTYEAPSDDSDLSCKMKRINLNCRELPGDLKEKIKPLFVQFQKAIQSQTAFLEITEKNPRMAIVILKKYPHMINVNAHAQGQAPMLFLVAKGGNKEVLRHLVKRSLRS